MRLVIQRVKEAKVLVGGSTVGAIGQGLLVLLGIHRADGPDDIDYYVGKLVNLRIFSDENDKMNLSLIDVGGEILLVSQFTLYANCKKGMRPSFVDAAPPEIALSLYEQFIEKLRKQVTVKTGKFGAKMEVHLINDGPVTIFMD